MKTLLSGFVIAIAFLPQTVPAAPPITTTATGVYDETTTQTNNVDFNATGNTATASTGNGATYSTIGTFNPAVAAAFAAGFGGVAAFDDLSTLTSSSSMNVFYNGTGKLFTMSFSNNYTVSTGTVAEDSSPVSALNYLEPNAIGFSSPQTLTISFGPITGGVLGENFSQLGITLLSANSGSGGPAANFGAITVMATFSDNSTASAVRTISEGKGAGDTFYGFAAPLGLTIKSLTISSAGGIGVPDIDDIGFITTPTAVPEPASYALIFLGLLCFAGGRAVSRLS